MDVMTPRGERGLVLEHRYGDRVRIADDLFLRSVLARLGSPDIPRAEVIAHLRTVYELLGAWAVSAEFPCVEAEVPTRMAADHPRAGVYRGAVLDPDVSVVVVDVMRGGILPAQFCFELLTSVLPDDRVRLDHLDVSRTLEGSRVTGAEVRTSKIGGPVDGAFLLVPDPMGATGSTVNEVIATYLRFGRPAKILALPMIATPEFFRSVLDFDADVRIYTARVDRGLSPAHVLESVPGEHWEEECGLDDRQYIVPGAGGVGEVLNNAFC